MRPTVQLGPPDVVQRRLRLDDDRGGGGGGPGPGYHKVKFCKVSVIELSEDLST